MDDTTGLLFRALLFLIWAANAFALPPWSINGFGKIVDAAGRERYFHGSNVICPSNNVMLQPSCVSINDR